MNEKPPQFDYEEQSKDKLQLGEEFLHNVGGIPDGYHIDAKQKLLFAEVKEEDDVSGFPVEKGEPSRFTALGFEHAGRRYPYSEDYDQLIHSTIIESCIDGYDGSKPVSDYLKDMGETPFRQVCYDKMIFLKENQMMEYKKELEELSKSDLGYGGKIKLALREKKEKDGSNESERDYKLGVLKDEGYLSEEDVERCKNFSTDRNKLVKEFKEIIRESSSTSDINNYAEDVAKLLMAYTFSIGVAIGQEYMRSERKPSWVGDILLKKMDSHDARKFKNQDSVDPEEEKDKLMDYLSKRGIGENENIKLKISEIEDFTRKYYGEVQPKYFIAEREYFRPSKESELNKKISELEEYREEQSNEFVDKSVADLKAKIVENFFPGEKIKDVYFLFSGIIAEDENGKAKTVRVSPLDKRIVGMFDEEVALAAWRESWIARQNEYDEIVCSAIDAKLNKENGVMDYFDKEVVDFSLQNQLSLPKSFDPETGRVMETIQPHDLKLLKEMVPIIGKFVDGVTLADDEEEISLKSLRLGILDYLSGMGSIKTKLCTEDKEIKIRTFESLIARIEPEKYDKAFSRLVSELGMVIFDKLDPDTHEIFSNLIAPRANVSRAAFYRVYRNSIGDGNKRRRIAERTLFVHEFIKYLKGDSSPNMSDFFSTIEKKPVINGDDNQDN